MNNATKKTASDDGSRLQELEGKIRQRAYELYEESGREDGHELEDWLRAKEEITKKKHRAASAS